MNHGGLACLVARNSMGLQFPPWFTPMFSCTGSFDFPVMYKSIVFKFIEQDVSVYCVDCPWEVNVNIRLQFTIHNIFIVSQHTSYMIHNVSTQITFYWHIHIYILQWQAYIMGAKGAGNPIGFMGPLSDTLNLIYLNKGAGGARVQQW